MTIKFFKMTDCIKNEYIIFILGMVIGGVLLSGCKKYHTEHFSSNSKNNKEKIKNWTKDAKKFAENNLYQDHLIKNQTYSGENNFKKDNEKFFLTETIAKPECCPSTYSNSQGCLCMTPEQNDFLNERANNRSYGEY